MHDKQGMRRRWFNGQVRDTWRRIRRTRMKNPFGSGKTLLEIAETFPTLFYLYDEEGFRRMDGRQRSHSHGIPDTGNIPWPRQFWNRIFQSSCRILETDRTSLLIRNRDSVFLERRSYSLPARCRQWIPYWQRNWMRSLVLLPSFRILREHFCHRQRHEKTASWIAYMPGLQSDCSPLMQQSYRCFLFSEILPFCPALSIAHAVSCRSALKDRASILQLQYSV